MRRTPTKAGINTTRKADIEPEFDARAEITAIKARMARLELRIPAEERKRTQITVGPTSSAKRGPKPKHATDIHSKRDQFVLLLEAYWPEIEPFCGPIPNMHGLQSIFASLSRPQFGHQAEPARELLQRITYLEQFLTNSRMQKRFQKNPRVLAAALSGVPGVGLERSLRLCPLKSCVIPVQHRAMRSYLRRIHPNLYRALLAGLDCLTLIAWLKEYKSKDEVLKQYGAIELQEAWDTGKADYARLQMDRRTSIQVLCQ